MPTRSTHMMTQANWYMARCQCHTRLNFLMHI